MSNVLSAEERARKLARGNEIINGAKAAARNLTSDEARECDTIMGEVSLSDAMESRGAGSAGVPETRGVGSASGRAPGGVEGRANEVIKPGQFREWYDKAARNNVAMTVGSSQTGYQTRTLRSQGTDRDVNRAFGEVLGFAPKTLESRALLEDTGGSAVAITPQAGSQTLWTFFYRTLFLVRLALMLCQCLPSTLIFQFILRPSAQFGWLKLVAFLLMPTLLSVRFS